MNGQNSLPDGWVEVSLKDISHKKVEQGSPVGKEFFYIDIGSVGRNSKRIAEIEPRPSSTAPSRAKQRVRTGDVLVSMTRPNLNAVAVVPKKLDRATASTGLDVLRPIETDPNWIFAHVRSKAFIGEMSGLVQGALYPAVKSDDVRASKIPLPPLNEQRRIVSKIKALESHREAAQVALDAIPPLLEKFRQSVLAAAFRGDLTREWRTQHPDVEPVDTTDLPELPTGWGTTNLPELAGSSGIFTDGDWVESKDQDPAGNVRLIQLADVGDGFYRDRSSRFLTGQKANALGCTFIKTGDVLISRLADPLGRACIFPGDAKRAVTVVDVAIFRRSNSAPIEAVWLKHWINSPQFRRRIDLLSSGTTRKRISRKNLGAIAFPLPSLGEQRRIAEIVDAYFALADEVESALTSGRGQLSLLSQSILAKAFRGELVPQDPNDEPASALLDRIRAKRAAATPPTKKKKRKSK